ncbi:hypothetical protein KA529_00785 [Candidatus Saccharibacteria bacterium]|jgi:hypothetical protein|nr:hypothetical protein [Candidatus Saccharibacteria bacterium]
MISFGGKIYQQNQPLTFNVTGIAPVHLEKLQNSLELKTQAQIAAASSGRTSAFFIS